MSIKMTTAQKLKYKATKYNNPWNPPVSITVYFMQLNWFQVSLGNRGIVTSNAEKNNGGRSANVAEQDVHRRPDWCVGEKVSHTADMGQAPDLLHQKWLKCKQYSAMMASNCISKRQLFLYRRQQ